jgi:hypothetical protein
MAVRTQIEPLLHSFLVALTTIGATQEESSLPAADLFIAGAITPTGYLAPRMSPGLRPPPLFRCARHPIDEIVVRSTVDRPITSDAHRAQGIPGAPRSEIKEEAKPGDIRGGEYPVACAHALNDNAKNTQRRSH